MNGGVAISGITFSSLGIPAGIVVLSVILSAVFLNGLLIFMRRRVLSESLGSPDTAPSAAGSSSNKPVLYLVTAFLMIEMGFFNISSDSPLDKFTGAMGFLGAASISMLAWMEYRRPPGQ